MLGLAVEGCFRARDGMRICLLGMHGLGFLGQSEALKPNHKALKPSTAERADLERPCAVKPRKAIEATPLNPTPLNPTPYTLNPKP